VALERTGVYEELVVKRVKRTSDLGNTLADNRLKVRYEVFRVVTNTISVFQGCDALWFL
jgi:hypothetical protein